MTPHDIIIYLATYSPGSRSIVCEINSGCKGYYLCGTPKSSTEVLNFDKIKEKFQDEAKIPYSKSVDAVCATPQNTRLCFIEMKSWEMFLRYNNDEKAVEKQSEKYGADLPDKLSSSITLCNQILSPDKPFDNCRLSYILLTDIDTETNGIASINENLAMLTGTASNLKDLCNRYSQSIMDGIDGVDTHYWCCRDFDDHIANL